jgi:hypothetical protein
MIKNIHINHQRSSLGLSGDPKRNTDHAPDKKLICFFNKLKKFVYKKVPFKRDFF